MPKILFCLFLFFLPVQSFSQDCSVGVSNDFFEVIGFPDGLSTDTFSVDVFADSDCAWYVLPHTSDLQVIGGSCERYGSQTITLKLSQNYETVSHSVTINDQIVYIQIQPSPSIDGYGITGKSIVEMAGGNFSGSTSFIRTGLGKANQIKKISDSDWITVSNIQEFPVEGTPEINGTFDYSVNKNLTGFCRSAKLQYGHAVLTIVQKAEPSDLSDGWNIQ